MLEKLFASESKIKILNTFFSNPEKTQRLLELSRFLSLPIATLKKELELLTSLGLLENFFENHVEEEPLSQEPDENEKAKKLTKKKVGKKKNLKNKTKSVGGEVLFRLNNNFFLFNEIKALLAKNKILLSLEIFKALEKDCRPSLLILTGKFIDKVEMPTDILIVGNISRRLFLAAISELEKVLGREINFTIFSDREYTYRRDIMDVFLYNILEGEKIILVGGVSGEINI